MRISHKLISAGLLAVILFLPMLSFACASSSAGDSHCPPGCPMAKMMKAKMQAAHLGTGFDSAESDNCCTIRSSSPAPLPESNIAPQATNAVPVVVTVATAAPVVNRRVVRDVDTGPPAVPDSQARLCTFLI